MRNGLNFSSDDYRFLLSSYLGVLSEKTKIVKLDSGKNIRVNRFRAPFTCWGFVCYVLRRHFGVEKDILKDKLYVKDAWKDLGNHIDCGEEKALDLIFFEKKRYGIFVPGHVGIVTSRKRQEYIHAPGKANSKISFAEYEYGQDGLLGFKRIIDPSLIE